MLFFVLSHLLNISLEPLFGGNIFERLLLSQALGSILIKHKSLLLVCSYSSCVDKGLTVSKQVQKKHHKIVRFAHPAFSDKVHSDTCSVEICKSLISSAKLFITCQGHKGRRAIAISKE